MFLLTPPRATFDADANSEMVAEPEPRYRFNGIPSVLCRHIYVDGLHRFGGYTVAQDDTKRPIDRVIARRKHRYKEMYESKPVELDDFDELIGSMNRIREAKGRVKINKLNLRSDAVSDILSMCFYELIKGAPGLTGSRQVKQNADEFAASVAPIISDIREKNPDIKTYQQVADELTERKVKTSRSKGNQVEAKWHPKTVQNIEERINALKQAGKLSL